jgi:hypothetical protein
MMKEAALVELADSSEMPHFAQGLEYYSQFKQTTNGEQSQQSSSHVAKEPFSFKNQLQKKASISFGYLQRTQSVLD